MRELDLLEELLYVVEGMPTPRIDRTNQDSGGTSPMEDLPGATFLFEICQESVNTKRIHRCDKVSQVRKSGRTSEA